MFQNVSKIFTGSDIIAINSLTHNVMDATLFLKKEKKEKSLKLTYCHTDIEKQINMVISILIMKINVLLHNCEYLCWHILSTIPL